MSPVWATILLAGAGTLAMRASFLVAAHRLVEVPHGVHRVLRQIPPAALAALVAPSLARPGGTVDLLQPRMAAGVVAALVAWRTGSASLTLVIGMGALVLLEHL